MRSFQRRMLGLLGISCFLFLGACGESLSTAGMPDWRLERDLTIGSLDDPEESLTAAGSLTTDDEGNIYLAQPRDYQIRVYSKGGELLRLIGREGEGPGEFRSIGYLGWLADTLYVGDSQNQRISFFRRDGSFIRSIRLAWSVIDDVFTPRTVSRVLPDGTVLVQPSFASRLLADGTITSRPLFRMDTTGTVLQTVAETSMRNSQLSIQRGTGGLYGAQLFSDAPLLALAPSGEYVMVLDRDAATQEHGEVMRLRKITVDGDTVFAHEIPYSPVPLPGEVVDSLLDAQAEGLSRAPMFESAREARQALNGAVFIPSFYPPASRIVVASNGEIWVRRENVSGSEIRWDVLSPVGDPVGKVILPASTRIHDSTNDWMWATERDELDVTYVVRYRILRE